MSISSMTERAATVDVRRTTAQTAAPDVAKAIAAVAAYFPTETVGTYLAVLAVIQPEENWERWGLYFLFLAFTVIFVLFYKWRKRQETGQEIDRRALGWLLLFSVVSFTIWSATMPWTPFLQITDDVQRYAGVVTIVLAPILPMAAQVLRISPPWR